MSNFNIPIDTGITGGQLKGFGDGAAIDAFARLRVSNPVQQYLKVVILNLVF